MSSSIFGDDVLFLQRLLRADGLYSGKLDGQWGPATEAAVNQFEAASAALKKKFGSFDLRSESNIGTVSLGTQRVLRKFMRRVLDGGVNIRILSGTRTYAEQNELFKKGRFGNAGPVVSNARGGQSNHNFCIAWDVGVFTSTGGYLSDGPEYTQVAELGVAADPLIEWGGSWKSFQDKPHYQLKLGLSVADLRTGFEDGSLHYPD